jgi:polyisoprenoid-binding protein YceI
VSALATSLQTVIAGREATFRAVRNLCFDGLGPKNAGSRNEEGLMNRFSVQQVSGLLVAFALASSACNTDPGKGKAHATVTTPSAEALKAAPAPAAGATRYSFSNDGSSLEFVGAKVTGKHDGKFEKFQGTIQVPDNDPTKGTVSVDVETASLVSDAEKLTGHLKSPDFLDVAKFPKATFVSTSVRAGGDGGASHTVTGNLTLHGVTKTISFPATVQVSGDSAEVTAEFAINRKDFGIVYPGKPDDLIRDDVLLKLKFKAKKG